MGALGWILVGLIAGVLAKIAMPGTDPGGIITTIVVGIIGALVGGFVVNQLTGRPEPMDFSLESILVATLGSIVLLAVYRFLTRRAA